MAEVLAVLSTAWRLVGAIRDVVALIKQTEEHGRALLVSDHATLIYPLIRSGLISDVAVLAYSSSDLSCTGQ
jgi:hypothetical protein